MLGFVHCKTLQHAATHFNTRTVACSESSTAKRRLFVMYGRENWGEMQCVAAWCIVLQCVAAWCIVLQCVAVCCSVLQWLHSVAMSIDACLQMCPCDNWGRLQCVAVRCSVLQCFKARCSVLQCVAVASHACLRCMSVKLGCVAVCCSVFKCVAVCCGVKQHLFAGVCV